MKKHQKTQFDKVSFLRSYIDETLRYPIRNLITQPLFEDCINEYGTEKQKELYERRLKEVA